MEWLINKTFLTPEQNLSRNGKWLLSFERRFVHVLNFERKLDKYRIEFFIRS